jgi:hypothetical protein
MIKGTAGISQKAIGQPLGKLCDTFDDMVKRLLEFYKKVKKLNKL